ncbi:type III pantothenate kinase [Desulforhabdus amnigena]|jgi:type III pantothenate kinase|uniref:Type III pantothenate kinase n=1 Tax=Desulforhabdus amnigena TaxID=40218 RepID=A0A9W6FTG4_9BACT|nr:type III pantothenate kinase [Desulforhabdus amnigena]NLJ27851.1 type III pantothenate kinase [Deltaproteobacteria bacterium]GLI33201.1 type III pantothenate kinase [Desulforhabdus amnigena]
MLLAMDIGNTNTVLGLFENDQLVDEWRIRTDVNTTVDEYGITIRSLFAAHAHPIERVRYIIISCVVPPVLNAVERFCKKYFSITPLVVGPGIRTGMPIFYDNPKEVGADRIVNAVAAYELFKKALIVVDFGTATTFDYVSDRGEYMGGVISPGIMISCEALFFKTSKLPRVEIFARPRSVLGKNTITSMNAGIVYGYAGLVEGIINRMKREVNSDLKVVATGGLALLIASECPAIDEVDDHLTLKGLQIIFDRNRKNL